MGGMEQLLPPGITALADCPYPLFEAIQMGLQFLGWIEELEEGEVPPRAIWFIPKLLDEWFVAVKKRRKEKYGGEDDKGKSPGPIDDPVQNEAARSLLVG